MFVAVDGKLAGLLAVADPVRANAHQAMADLHREGIRVIMLTGDNPITADAVARQVGVDEVHAEMRPGDKADFVARLKASGARVAMAGDGINDDPALRPEAQQSELQPLMRTCSAVICLNKYTT